MNTFLSQGDSDDISSSKSHVTAQSIQQELSQILPNYSAILISLHEYMVNRLISSRDEKISSDDAMYDKSITTSPCSRLLSLAHVSYIVTC